LKTEFWFDAADEVEHFLGSCNAIDVVIFPDRFIGCLGYDFATKNPHQ
jgi:hypothetical protein